jgi:hypothetical protein
MKCTAADLKIIGQDDPAVPLRAPVISPRDLRSMAGLVKSLQELVAG